MYISKLTKDVIYCVLVFIILLLVFITIQDNIVQNQLNAYNTKLEARQYYTTFKRNIHNSLNKIDSTITYIQNMPTICSNILHNKQLRVVNVNNIPTQINISQPSSSQLQQHNDNVNNVELIQRSDNNVEYYDIPLSYELQDYVRAVASSYNLDIKLVYAVMRTESNYDSTIISDTDDYGIMQINIVNHAFLSNALNIHDFLNVYDNINAGCYMLHNAVSQTNTLNEALMIYNLGYGGATEFWNAGIYNTNYSDTVISHYNNITIIE